MKKDNINYFAVGVFVLVMLILAFFALYRVTGKQVDAEQYYSVFKNITGINDGAAVTYGGYQIGQVAEITPIQVNHQTLYRLTLDIKGDWAIPDDSVAQILKPGLISDQQVEIFEGPSATNYQPGDTIASKASVNMMTLMNNIGNELDSFIPTMTSDISKLLNNLNASALQVSRILNDDNRQHVDNMFRNVEQSTQNLARLSAGFERANAQLNALLDQSNALLNDNNQDIRHSVIQLRDSIDTVSENIHAIMYNLDASSRNVNEFTRQLRDNPGVILGSKPPVDQAESQP